MSKVIGVRFKEGGKIYYFDPLEYEVKAGDGVIVDTARGIVFGDVSEAPHFVPDEQLVTPLKPVIRVATPEDHEQRRLYKQKEKDAFAICQRKIEEHGLVMKLVEVEYAWGGSKIMFYFTADGRVDFRELVKDLAGVFKTRIELRQIGVRDEAKMLGGLGVCGRPICCASFLTDFIPVSIKMAKEQNLSLNQTKISGICGRLMCCLKFEQSSYESMHKIMPKVGKEVVAPDGVGTALENNVISETTAVKVQLADGTFEVKNYPFRELTNKAGKPFGEVPEEPAACPGCGGCPAAEAASKASEAPDVDEAPVAAEADPLDTADAGNSPDGDTL
ncbi:MAG: stage 0 sporulation family protein [Clostridia bacterium]|nr:stage 0 sporulation family protein [Clostridia bacterium]